MGLAGNPKWQPEEGTSTVEYRSSHTFNWVRPSNTYCFIPWRYRGGGGWGLARPPSGEGALRAHGIYKQTTIHTHIHTRLTIRKSSKCNDELKGSNRNEQNSGKMWQMSPSGTQLFGPSIKKKKKHLHENCRSCPQVLQETDSGHGRTHGSTMWNKYRLPADRQALRSFWETGAGSRRQKTKEGPQTTADH